MDEALLGIFRAEADQLLGRMAESALALEEAGEGPALIDQMFRDVHTVKGSAGLVGFTPAADVAHALEDVLGDLRAGRRGLDAPLVDAVLRGIDDLRDVIGRLAAGEVADHAAAAAVARVRAVRDPAPAAPDAAGPEAPGTAAQGDGPAAADPAHATGAGADAASPAAAAPIPPGATPVTPPGVHTAPAPAASTEEAVRVPLVQLDRLVRLAGEAVAGQLALGHELAGALAADPDAAARAARLDRTLRALQEATLRTRMTTLAAIAEPLRRAARDVARAEGKQVAYEHDAERAELDRAVLDALRDPLLHLVRNAVGHGVERPEARRAAGKDATGRVVLTARRAGGEVVVEVADDGAGLDLDRLRATAGRPDLDDAAAAELVFAPGVSTADEVTEVSGRGVGLDAVREAVRALRGTLEVVTRRGEGTTFVLRVPMSLAVLPCVLAEAGGRRYALPAHAAATVVEAADEARVALEGRAALWVGGDIVPVTPLADVLGLGGGVPGGPAIVLTGDGGRRHALRVDALVGQRRVTVTDLGRIVPRNDLVAGASIEPDGSVLLVLDAAAVVARAGGGPRAGRGRPAAPGAAAGSRTSVLVVDDAMTVRELQRAILERAGFAVAVAVDGEDALARLDAARPDLVITDIEMPRLDGFGLVAAVRARPALQGLPVVVVSSRADEADRRRALSAGADAYIVKKDFDEAALLGVVRDLLGATTTP